MVYGVLEAYHFEEGEVEDGDFFCVDEGKSFRASVGSRSFKAES